ncbi:class I SAM-dependent methyltransferase [Aurantiacibacter poecillastricola]|uniref:class I SAM-dependent methyltransferase n=1 Tax=Aurantiacibacter poecillastricola TaxID=3064385 RepID=UPI00273EA9D8|nr:class I SAM-dependent methyltransferase [Aurantiacibacter sp. 219JJ12-13]MDP5261703.1 methyltransferase domain-containing protein [Aurantiacibacter sp. 219JJ12-13]
MTDKTEWQGSSGQTWSAQWRRTDRGFTHLTERLLDRTREHDFRQVLDIGCGAGELSLAIARNRPDVAVRGVDISPALIAAARERGSRFGNLQFELADAAEWHADDENSPDLLVSRHGVMFFDDPPGAFANLAHQAQPGARLLFSCFRDIAQNPCFAEVIRLLPEAPPPMDPAGPGPFAFADQDWVISILRAGGWESIDFERFDFPMIAGTGDDPVGDAVTYFSLIGPAARASAEMDIAARERFLARVRELCERNCRSGIVSLSAAAWIVTAKRSA